MVITSIVYLLSNMLYHNNNVFLYIHIKTRHGVYSWPSDKRPRPRQDKSGQDTVKNKIRPWHDQEQDNTITWPRHDQDQTIKIQRQKQEMNIIRTRKDKDKT